MTSPVSGLINTIVTLQELRLRNQAAKLAQEQFGLTQRSTEEQMLGHLQGLIQNVPQDKRDELAKLIPDFAKHTGYSPESINNLFAATPPSAATTQAGAIAGGAQELAGGLNKTAATVALTQSLPGALASDTLHGDIFNGARSYLSQLAPDQVKDFNAGVLQRLGTGQDLKSASMDQLFFHMPEDIKKQATLIGAQLAPSAEAVVQNRLGAGELALRQNALANDSANQEFMHMIALAEAKAKLSGDAFKTANELIKDRENAVQDFIKNSQTLTEEGLAIKRGQINAYNRQLKALNPADPSWTGLFIDLKPGESPATTSAFLKFLGTQKALP